MQPKYCDQCGTALNGPDSTHHQPWCPKLPKNGGDRPQPDPLDQPLTMRALYEIGKRVEHSPNLKVGSELRTVVITLVTVLRDMAADRH